MQLKDALIIFVVTMLVIAVFQVQSKFEKEYNYLRYELDLLKQRADSLERWQAELRDWIDQWVVGEFDATAYTLDCGNGDGYTATMTIPRKGVIAVDPKVIPLGTEVYIDGLGWYRAEDTGGLIKGKRIDIYMDDIESALEWGRRKVKLMYRGGRFE